jgi:hypothetical protein
MNKRIAISMVLGIPLMLNLSCEGLPPSLPSSGGQFLTDYVSPIGEKDIHFTFTEAQVAKFPAWDPAKPLPIPIKDVIATAEKELPKYIKDTKGWALTEISITQITAIEGQQKWVYRPSFSNNRYLISIPVTFAGEPVQGKEQKHDKSN